MREFLMGHLVEVLQRNRALSSQTLLASIVEEVRQFSPNEQRDDITLIIARHTGS